MKQFHAAKKRISVSVGESVRIVRELQRLSQNQLAERTGIAQATLSAIENDRVRLGVERAKVLARALKCHPAVLVFPGRAGKIILRLRHDRAADALAAGLRSVGPQTQRDPHV
jgi:transcriptional regulator with XRE-family HTH domain